VAFDEIPLPFPLLAKERLSSTILKGRAFSSYKNTNLINQPKYVVPLGFFNF